MILLVLACDGAPTCETGCKSDPATGSDDSSTRDSGPTDYAETGVGLVWYTGSASVIDGDFRSGYFGFDFTPQSAFPEFEPYLCLNVGEWHETGPAPEGCPDCEWSFQLRVTDTTTEGDHCREAGLTDGYWDGFDGGWGFAPRYTEVYGTYSYELDTVVFYYFTYSGSWYPLAWNDGYYEYNTGDAEDLVFHRFYSMRYYFF